MLASTLRRTALPRLSTLATAIPSSFSPGRLASPLLSRHLHTSFCSPSQHNLQQPPSQREAVQGLRQRNVPLAGTNDDADSAISGFMNMFNDKESRTVSISVCTKHGFVTTEAITLQGPVLCIGGQVFLWDIFRDSGAVRKALNKNTDALKSASGASGTGATTLPTRSVFETMDEDTAKEIFKVFELMNPRPEILIIGTGKSFAPLSPAVRSVIRRLGLQVDMMSTANAAATYNMLAEEGREVAAALLPLEPSTVQTIHNSNHH
ncbi:hypothetical protein BC939DRAFT_462373 [Gamsiella multidivaricata]|uniref:uncharacterized protein n=1 Tax=Gamsiella multidivaricata TaxID=101098 RepID=UPI002220A725|nr:uncharacterized protein BC939DRAFT_462373 [Gamsiella multidivaricata]KAI7818645.1 hypothetical protein BC939DRAFT_462373 [Gamsiella multidivaricata]